MTSCVILHQDDVYWSTYHLNLLFSARGMLISICESNFTNWEPVEIWLDYTSLTARGQCGVNHHRTHEFSNDNKLLRIESVTVRIA